MNIKRRLLVILMVVAMCATLLPCIFASASDDAITAKGYVVGNSLTMSMSPRRLAALLKTQDYNVTFGGQLNGDTSLPEQIGMMPVDGTDPLDFISWKMHKPTDGSVVQEGQSKPGAMSDAIHGLDNTISGRYFEAMSQNYFDFVSLQSYGAYVDTPKQWDEFTYDHTVKAGGKDYYEYQYIGDRQAIGIMVDYATQQYLENGKGSTTFLIYESWTYLNKVGSKNFYDFYNSTYNVNAGEAGSTQLNKANEHVPKKEASNLLMSELREDFSYLDEDTIRLVPVSGIFAELDKRIREGTLPGFEEYMQRNAEYYYYARKTTPQNVNQALLNAPLDDIFVQEQGIYNLFVDSVHMASFSINYPDSGAYTGLHSGERDGTLASYITCCAMYSVLTGYSPIGLPVDMESTDRRSQFVAADRNHDARLDAEADAELIRAVQEVIFDVLCENAYTGIDEDAPMRTSTSVGHTNGNGQIARITALADAPARIATEIATVLVENPAWTPVNAPVALPAVNATEEKKTKEI